MRHSNIELYSRVITKCLIESLKKKGDNFVGLDKVIADLDNTGNYFLDVFNNKGVDLGILRLRKGETDTQLPHSVNEVYFIVEGNGNLLKRQILSLFLQMYNTDLLSTMRI